MASGQVARSKWLLCSVLLGLCLGATCWPCRWRRAMAKSPQTAPPPDLPGWPSGQETARTTPSARVRPPAREVTFSSPDTLLSRLTNSLLPQKTHASTASLPLHGLLQRASSQPTHASLFSTAPRSTTDPLAPHSPLLLNKAPMLNADKETKYNEIAQSAPSHAGGTRARAAHFPLLNGNVSLGEWAVLVPTAARPGTDWKRLEEYL